MMSQDELRLLVREMVREMVAEELQTLLFFGTRGARSGKRGTQERHLPGEASDAVWSGRTPRLP